MGAARGDPGQVGELVGRHRDQLRDPVAQGAQRRGCAAPARPRPTGRRRRSGRASGRSWRSPRPGRGRRRAAGCRRRGRSRRGSPCGACQPGLVGLVVEELAGQPGGTQRQRPGDVRPLVGAAGDLERAAADVEDGEPAGGPAEPAAYGEEGQPRLVLAGEHLDVDAGALAHQAEDALGVAGVAHRGGRERQHLLAALVLRDDQRLGDEAGQRIEPGLRDRAVARRGARPAAAAACGRTPAAVPRRRGRRPPADGRCWSRCRGRRGACAPTYRARCPAGP